MPEKRDAFGPLRPWVAPGMTKAYAPLLGGGIAAVVLLIGWVWDIRRRAQL
jgi:hypothetical protein